MFLGLAAIALIHSQSPAGQVLYSKIPEPLPMPAATEGDPADILASKIANREPDAGPALIAAIQACGFSVVDHSRKVILKPLTGKGCGISLEDYEVIRMLNLSPRRPGVKFKTISDSLVVLSKPGNLQAIHQEIISGWQNAFKSKNPYTSFLARFIDDLSIHGASPWSIWGPTTQLGQFVPGAGKSFVSGTPLAAGTAPTGRLAAIQAYSTSILTDLRPTLSNPNLSMQDRMAAMQLMEPAQLLQSQATLTAMGIGTTPSPDATDPRQYKDCPLSMIQFVLLARRLYADAYHSTYKIPKHLHASLHPSTGDNPDYSGNIMDVSATGISTFFNKLIVTAENVGEVGAGAVDVTSTIGAWGKAIANFMNLQVTLEPQNIALQRRKDKKPGDPLKVTATIKYVTDSDGSAELSRAGRMMSWGLGADITVNDSGPAAGAQVNWHIDETGSVLEHAAQFVSPGQAGDGKLQVEARTDKAGTCEIGIQATPQREVKPDNSIPYDRYGRIEVEVSLKGANLFQDIVDSMSAVASVATGDVPALIKSTLPDMLSRTSLFSTKFFPLTVHDWTPPLYEGTFTLEVKGDAERHVKDDNEVWKVRRKATGKIYSIYRGFNIRDTLLVEGRGSYYLQIEDIHDVDVLDLLNHSYMGGDSCGGKSTPVVVTRLVKGPVARIGYPYTLQGGQLELKSQHTDAGDSMLVSGNIAWSLPCNFIQTITDSPTESGIQSMDIPIKFTTTIPPHPTVLKGLGFQTQTIVLGGLKGELHATLEWELHRVAGTTK